MAPNGTAFYVKVPDDQDPAWRIKHADETVNTMGAFFKNPHGDYLCEEDGTYEVKAPAPSAVSTVRSMLTDHEGLIIVREKPLDGGIFDLLVSE